MEKNENKVKFYRLGYGHKTKFLPTKLGAGAMQENVQKISFGCVLIGHVCQQ